MFCSVRDGDPHGSLSFRCGRGGVGAAEVYPLLPVLLDLKGKGLCETNAGAGETKCLNQ